MPRLSLPDGAELHWEERGQGPLVVLTLNFWGYPALFEDLVNDLAGDHRVVTYDLRGNGRSSREGPFDMATDVSDLTALAEEVGGSAVAMAMGDGAARAVRVAATRPELIRAVACPAFTPFSRIARGAEGLAGSESVLDLLHQQMTRDYRGALHTMVAAGNPQLDAQELRERIDLTMKECPQDAAAARLRAWMDDESAEDAIALGDRLWMFRFGDNPWFPASLAEQARELAPEAHMIDLEDGPVSRPDLTAAVVRRAVAAAQAART
jgi:pimeloyl-ACP methyl ester carboxylesterase